MVSIPIVVLCVFVGFAAYGAIALAIDLFDIGRGIR